MSDKKSVPKTTLGTKIKMGVLERLVVQKVLPEEGNLTDMEIVNDIREKVKLTEKETKDFGIQQQGDSLTWDNAKIKDVVISFSKAEIRVLKDGAKRASDASKVTADMVGLCRKLRDI